MKKIYLTLFLFALIAGAVHAEYPAPEKKDMTLDQMVANLLDFDRKVVEVEVNAFSSLKQEAKGGYSLTCSYYDDSNWNLLSSRQMYFSGEKGKKFFDELIKKNNGSNLWGELDESIYVYVEGNRLTALGTRYSKTHKEYKW